MLAVDLLSNLATQGYDLEADGSELVVEGPPLTEDLSDLIRENKPGLCHLLNLKDEAGPDWAWIAQDAVKLAEFAELVQTNRLRRLGEVPSHWTAETTYRHCGPVPIWPGCAPQVSACPWCFNRVSGNPMPVIYHN